MQYIYILHTTATHSDYLLLCDEKRHENCDIAFVKASTCKQIKNYIVPTLFINECFVKMLLECGLGCSVSYPTSEVSKRCQKYASGVHISSTVIIWCMCSQNKKKQQQKKTLSRF